MTHPSNLAKWVTGVSDFEQMIKNLQLDVRLDKHIINTDLCHEWFSIKPLSSSRLLGEKHLHTGALNMLETILV
jgi:hypothetical protein